MTITIMQLDRDIIFSLSMFSLKMALSIKMEENSKDLKDSNAEESSKKN